MDDIVSFGYWVRRRRKALDLTQGDLARRVGCAEVTIQKIEADARRPSRQIAERLAEQLAIPADERAAFLQCARAELAVNRLVTPILPIAQPASPPSTIRPTRAAQPALPSGMVTFLFTDIEGSTSVWEREPAQMRLALARHHAILRTTIAAQGGHAYKIIGDAFQAAFALPAQAVAAALAAQRAFAAQAWETSAPVRVRMGVHVGPAAAEGNDYTTTHTLNRVARIMAAGHGGQILLSGEVADLVRRDLPTDVTLRDMGQQRMKGLTQLEHLFQLVAPDLPASFPPLKTLDPFRTNLPAQLTSFVGREQAITDVTQLLTTARLVTLTGPGGTGKTRLALQVAAELALTPNLSPIAMGEGSKTPAPPRLPQRERPVLSVVEGGLGGEGRFPDGVWLVELAPLADATLVPRAVASALGLREEAGRPILATLTDFLRARHLLLILDNCEHVLEACAQLAAALLRGCPNVRILASSREALGSAGEAPFRVPSLATPDPRRLPPIETLADYEAVRLFVERATTVLPGFRLTSDNAPAVAQVCARLDGIPLALELAAARVNVLRVEQIAARLDDRFRLLTGGSRTAVPRQQTLRALIDWSYDLLAEPERVLLRRLSVFAGGWTLEAAEAVCAGDGLDHDEVLDVLAQLVNKSLVVADREQGQETRYRLLETIRQYALERLAASGEADAIRRRHAEYFLVLAEIAGVQLQRAGQRVWLDRLEAEHDNLRAALAWAFGGGDAELGVRLSVALAGIQQYAPGFWSLRGYWSERHRWLEVALSKSSGVAPRLRAMLLTRILDRFGFDSEPQDAMHEEALALFRAAGATSGIALTLMQHGALFLYRRSDYPQATRLLEASLALYQELDDRHGIAIALHLLGDCAREQGDLVRAAALLEESIALFHELGANESALASALNGLGDVAYLQGDDARAMALWWEAVALSQSVGDRWSILWPLRNLCWLALERGDDGRVLALLEAQVGWHRERGPDGLVYLLHVLGALVNAQGDAARATALLREALVLQQSHAGKGSIASSLERFAGIAAGQGQPDRAARLLGAAEALRKAIGAPLPPVERPDYERTVAAARAQFDAATFATAWAEGQALTLEQVIAEALDVEV